jgi:hypothetical protein
VFRVVPGQAAAQEVIVKLERLAVLRVLLFVCVPDSSHGIQCVQVLVVVMDLVCAFRAVRQSLAMALTTTAMAPLMKVDSHELATQVLREQPV